MNFKKFIVMESKRDDMIGDLCKDLLNDPTDPKIKFTQKYLKKQTKNTIAQEACILLIKEYKLENENIRNFGALGIKLYD